MKMPNVSFQPTPPDYLPDTLRKQGLLGRWYQLLAFHLPEGQQPTLKDQEIIRRSRLATFVLLVQLVFIEGPVVPVVAAAPNHSIVMPWLLACIGILLFAFVCNRLGKLTTAGLLMVASIEVTVCLKIVTLPGGIGVANLPQFDILIQPVLLAVVLLPPWSAFVVAGFNMVFILYSLFAGPHAPDLIAALRDPRLQGDILAVPVMAQFIIATVAYLIVANLLTAIKRASRAEQIAHLEHAISQQRAETEQRNRELEVGISAITYTLQSAANSRDGAFERVMLPPGHVLLPMLQQLQHFLERYQRSRQAENHMAATTQACTELIQALERASSGQPARLPPRRNTPIDGIIFVLENMQQRQQMRRSNPSGVLGRTPSPDVPQY